MPEAVHSGGFLVPILIFLAAAVVAVPLFKLAGLGAVVGFLAAGLAIGPSGFGLIHDPASTLHIAELGVVLLLFIIGLELKPSQLIAMRKDIAVLGTAQMIMTTVVICIGLMLFSGFNVRAGLVAGMALAFSSTAIAVQLLDERGAREASYGRRAFAILLFQDVMVAPVLAITPLLAGGMAGSNWSDVLLGFAAVVAAFAIVIFAGRFILNPFFSFLARTGSGEIMTAAALLVVLGAALLMQQVGMSMALGAFLAGLLLSESRFRHELEADIEPFRGLLMGLFFMSVGMSLDRKVVADSLPWLTMAVIAVLMIKAIIVFVLMRTATCNNRDAIEGASVLPMAGEFAFVVFPVAASVGILTAQQSSLLAALTAITMIASPLIAKATEAVLRRSAGPVVLRDAEDIPDAAKGKILVVGFGRFGQLAVQVLLSGRADVTVIDKDEARIATALSFGFKVYYGDGTRLDVLRAAGAGGAQILAVCVDVAKDADTIVDIAKQHFPLTTICVRAYDRIHALKLMENGVDNIERETAEGAIRFGGNLYKLLTQDAEKAGELVEFVRKRDAELLLLQRSEGIRAGRFGFDGVKPEPLVKPSREARNLGAELPVSDSAPVDGRRN